VPPSLAFPRCLLPFAMVAAPIARAQEPGETIEVQGARPAGSPRAPGTAATIVDTALFGGEVRSVAEMLSTPKMYSPRVTLGSESLGLEL